MNIYMITNKITGLSYIGKDQSDNDIYMGSGNLIWQSYRKRFNRSDLDSAKKSHHKWVYEQNKIFNLYEKKLLCVCNDEQILAEMESYFIHKYNTIRPNGYNIASGGLGGNLVAGYTQEEKRKLHEKISVSTTEAMARPEVRERLLNAVCNKSDEWKLHISESLTGRKGKPTTEETKKKLREINLGNKYGIGNRSRTGQKNSEETKKKISEAAKKVVHTEEWNKKVSESLKGKAKSEAHKAALRKPKPKYEWLLPDGSKVIMSANNGARHKDWIRLDKISC